MMNNPTYFSQHGEDIVAQKVFGRSNGPHYFVEVGMIDGRRFSNTLALELRGWGGLCVEAHPKFVESVRLNRPNSTVIHAAASDTTGLMPFYADPRGDLSSLVDRSEAEMKHRFGEDYRGFETVEVSVRTLNEMLYEADAPCGMEVVSIDIEGGELAALRGFDLAYWKPRMLLIEADNFLALQKLIEQLEPAGYRLARMVGVNAAFCRTALDAARVRLARVDERVLHTANPCDEAGKDQMIIPSEYETRSQYATRWLRRFGKAA